MSAFRLTGALRVALIALLLAALPRAAWADNTPHIAIVQCLDTNDEDWYGSHTSSQALVGLAVLLGVRYDTFSLEDLLDESGRLYGHVHLFVNGRDAPYLQDGLETRLAPDDSVDLFPAIGGG